MRNKKVFDMTILSMFLTIFLILSFVPQLGYITVPFLPLVGGTTLHIPVLVAIIYFGFKIGVSAGLFFGISSWIVALIRAVTPIELAFRNPLIAILPRVLFAILTIYVFKLLSKYLSKKIAIVLTAGIGTLIHSILVILTIVLFAQNSIATAYGTTTASIQNIMNLIYVILVFNSTFEIILAIFLVSPIVIALFSMYERYTGSFDLENINE